MEVVIDDDDDVNDDLRDQGDDDSPIEHDFGDHCSPLNDQDRLEVDTQNWLMLEMLLENQAQGKSEQTHEREWMAAEQECMAAEQDE